MHRSGRLAACAAALAVVAGLLTGVARAADGDPLASFDASATAGIPFCQVGVGTGIAFDGTDLLLSCWGSNVLQRVDPVTHLSHGSVTVAGGSDFGALAYDATRDRVWACQSFSTVVRIDLGTLSLDPGVSLPVAGCVDGLAYDATDDTLWTSPDADGTDYHYRTDGTPIASFANAGRLGACGNSGIAVGGDKLYLANNGCSQIYQVAKDFTSSSLLSTFPRRIEDLECDEMTFAPKAAIWSVDAYDRELNAWEIPAGSCNHGGGVLPCADLTVAVTRPIAGHDYLNDDDLGVNGSGTTVVQGAPLTITASSSDLPLTDSVEFFVDGASRATDSSPPYSYVHPSSLAPGAHTLKVLAHHTGPGHCRTAATLPITVTCPAVNVAVVRPVAGHAYAEDSDVGASTVADAEVLGGPLTVKATSSDAARTASVTFSVDGVARAPITSPPFDDTLQTDGLADGLHVIGATLAQTNEGCSATTSIAIRKITVGLGGLAKGVTVTTNVPAEPQLHAGGAHLPPAGGNAQTRVLDRSLAPAVDSVHVVTDSTSGARGASSNARADSVLTDVSVLGGLVKAEVLHATARAAYDFANGAATSSGGDSRIVGLVVGGTPVAASQPNTVVPLPGGLGRVVVQETLAAGSGARAELTVNMLHVFANTPSFKGEIVLASAYAGVAADPPVLVGPDNDLIHRDDDAGSNVDAGADDAGAVAITPGVYSGGLLRGDATDRFAFQAGQGDRIVIEMKPADRAVATAHAGGAPSLTGPDMPQFDLVLRDPSGNARIETGNITAFVPSEPKRTELNADDPIDGTRATWTVDVVRRGGSPDGFYSLMLAIPPVTLAAQNDAGTPGDAGDMCVGARALMPAATAAAEADAQAFSGVIRDTDTADYFSLRAKIGQELAVTVKPDELGDGADFDLRMYGANPDGSLDCSGFIALSTFGKDVAKGTPDALVLVPVPVTGMYAFGIERVNGVGNYYVSVAVANPLPTAPGNDASTGSDAADSCDAAAALASGAYEGRLGDQPVGDDADWYAVHVDAGADLTATMKPSDPSDFDLELFGPSCAPVAPDTLTHNQLPLSAPETVHIKDAAAGLWHLKVTRTRGGGNYLLSALVSP
jgi:hypothetical protein